jgi:Arc/MetJ-type ribon-helix-helix transcriptional regulator
MQITLPLELEQIVQTYIDSGKYQNAEEVLLAGVQLLQREETPANISFGTLTEHNQFFPLTELEMIQESLTVLENHRHNAIPHGQVETWANSLSIDKK